MRLFSLAVLQTSGKLSDLHSRSCNKNSTVTCSIISGAGVPQSNREGEGSINDCLYELFSTRCHSNWKKGPGQLKLSMNINIVLFIHRPFVPSYQVKHMRKSKPECTWHQSFPTCYNPLVVPFPASSKANILLDIKTIAINIGGNGYLTSWDEIGAQLCTAQSISRFGTKQFFTPYQPASELNICLAYSTGQRTRQECTLRTKSWIY